MADNLIKKIRTDKGDCQFDYTALANLPSSLKNPYSITFTGGASAEYDGSSDVTVKVPDLPDWVESDSNPSYTKEESSNRYAPIEAAIRPTVNGNPAECKNSVAWSFQGLKVYGKSSQNGTPSTENPVPIVSAGASGSIALSITDGASQSQSLAVSTPNGLPGIPVESGGNYTDVDGQQMISNYRDYAAGLDTIAVAEIDSYNGEAITTPYMSSTGQLTTGAQVLYALSEPYTQPIPDEELAAYRALTTYDGTTVVSTTELVAGIEARYIIDGTKYLASVTDRIATLEASQTQIDEV